MLVGGEPALDEVAQGAVGHEHGVAERLHCDRARAVAGGEPPLDAGAVVRLPRAQRDGVREDVQADGAPEQVRDAHLAREHLGIGWIGPDQQEAINKKRQELIPNSRPTPQDGKSRSRTNAKLITLKTPRTHKQGGEIKTQELQLPKNNAA